MYLLYICKESFYRGLQILPLSKKKVRRNKVHEYTSVLCAAILYNAHLLVNTTYENSFKLVENFV